MLLHDNLKLNEKKKRKKKKEKKIKLNEKKKNRSNIVINSTKTLKNVPHQKSL